MMPGTEDSGAVCRESKECRAMVPKGLKQG